MGLSFEMLLITSTAGAVQSFFFGVYLFTQKKGKNVADILLSLLLLAFAVRVTKSVGYYFADHHVIPDILMNLGFGCNLAILPLFWLYLNAFVTKDFAFRWRRDSIHLIPAFAALLLSPFLTDYFWLSQYGYLISLISMLAYLPFCVRVIAKNFRTLSGIERLWLLSLMIGITIVWLGYLLNFVLGLVPYITGPIIFSILVYFLSFLGLREHSLFNRDSKHRLIHNSLHLEACYTALMDLAGTAAPFKDPGLTLSKLATRLGVSNNLLSETINKKLGVSFSDFVNARRIRDAQDMMKKPGAAHQKIASIAYEAGFNSLSVFNSAFKKFTSQTPSEYRRQFEQER